MHASLHMTIHAYTQVYNANTCIYTSIHIHKYTMLIHAYTQVYNANTCIYTSIQCLYMHIHKYTMLAHVNTC